MTERLASPQRTLRSDIVFAFALLLACAVAWLVRDVLMLLYVSSLFATVLTPVVRFTSRLHIGRWRPFKGYAVFFLLLAMAAALTAFGFLALPPVIHDMQEFAHDLPARLPQVIERLKHIPFADNLNTEEITTKFQDFVSNAATYLLLSLRDWAGALVNVAMGFVLTVYFILEGKHAYAWFLSFFPPQSRDRLDNALQRARIRMDKWLVGQGSLMLILGLVSTIVYISLHIRYAFALGVLTGLLNIIPVLGAAACVALALLVAAIDSWGRVLGVAIFYVIYLQVENSYLTPRIMKNSVGLPGLAILVALLLGSALGGVPGALVSVPTAALVAVLVDEYLVNKD
ncbi:MAG TPA: AI-2E family transporter [Terracidiphilus sp.]|jgi:predicted PurR-regulated permease PerM|nr:AI-2E family transporter [Terracidiphilus sp.]